MNGEERPRKLGPCPYCGEDETRRLDGAVLSGVVPALLDPRCLISFGRYIFEWKSPPRAYEPTGLVGVRAIAVGRQVWARSITVYFLFLIHHKTQRRQRDRGCRAAYSRRRTSRRSSENANSWPPRQAPRPPATLSFKTRFGATEATSKGPTFVPRYLLS